jgi:tetratricopeptide (TPR) repeat protein
MILAQFNRFEEAIESYNKGIKANPKDFNIYNSKGAALKSLNKIKEAIKCFNKAIEINPTIGSYYNKGEALCKLKKYEEAISSYDKAIEINPNFEPAKKRRDMANFLLFLDNS